MRLVEFSNFFIYSHFYYVWVAIPTQGESSLEHGKKGDSRTDVVANYL